jgi:hypothetical protein
VAHAFNFGRLSWYLAELGFGGGKSNTPSSSGHGLRSSFSLSSQAWSVAEDMLRGTDSGVRQMLTPVAVAALGHSNRSEGMGPIAYLRLNKVEVRVKQVPFEPNFIFAFTGKSRDWGVAGLCHSVTCQCLCMNCSHGTATSLKALGWYASPARFTCRTVSHIQRHCSVNLPHSLQTQSAVHV